jgi:hypothetical protein
MLLRQDTLGIVSLTPRRPHQQRVWCGLGLVNVCRVSEASPSSGERSSVWCGCHRCMIRVNKFGAFYRNSLKFDGFSPVRIQKSPNTVHKFKKIKKLGKYVKKLDEILRLLVKKFFQINIVWLVKI